MKKSGLILPVAVLILMCNNIQGQSDFIESSIKQVDSVLLYYYPNQNDSLVESKKEFSYNSDNDLLLVKEYWWEWETELWEPVSMEEHSFNAEDNINSTTKHKMNRLSG